MNFTVDINKSAIGKLPSRSTLEKIGGRTNKILDFIIILVLIFHLTRPFKKWDAYALGIIDEKGKQIREPGKDEKGEWKPHYEAEKEYIAWTPLKKFLAKIKRLLTGKMVMSLLLFYTLLKEENETRVVSKEMIVESAKRKQMMAEVHAKVMDTLVGCNVTEEEYHTYVMESIISDPSVMSKLDVYDGEEVDLDTRN
jgi:hypothetical protein